jgi:serine/threonine protein kinase
LATPSLLKLPNIEAIKSFFMVKLKVDNKLLKVVPKAEELITKAVEDIDKELKERDQQQAAAAKPKTSVYNFNNDKLGMLTFDSEDKKYKLRYIDADRDIGQLDHFNFLTALQKYKRKQVGVRLTHLPQTTLYTEWTVDGNTVTTTDGLKLTLVGKTIPAATGNRGFYIQEMVGKPLNKWIESRYYNLDDDGKKIKSFKTQKSQLMGDDNVEGEDQARIDDIEQIVRQTKDALDQFHSLGFLHRDIKIENMTFDEKTKKVYIIDFDAVIKIGDKESINRSGGQIPMKNGETALMDRYSETGNFGEKRGFGMKKFLISENSKFADYHQAGMALLQLGGIFDWVGDYNWDADEFKDSQGKPTGQHPDRKTPYEELSAQTGSAFTLNRILDFWRKILEDRNGLNKGTNKAKQEARRKRGTKFIKMLRQAVSTFRAFNMPPKIVHDIAKTYFKTDQEIYPPASDESGGGSPVKFMSQRRQPVFEKVSLESDFDDEDLDALMEGLDDPLDDLEKELDAELGLDDHSDTTSHLSDAEFEQMYMIRKTTMP